MDRTDLHNLVNRIPESEIPAAGAFLDFLILRTNVDRVEKALDEAPYDDEEYSEDFLSSLETADKDVCRGETIGIEEVRQRLGLA